MLRFPFVTRKRFDRAMAVANSDRQYARDVVKELKDRYAQATFRHTMLSIENTTLRRELEKVKADLVAATSNASQSL